jgi:hypothetical protein
MELKMTNATKLQVLLAHFEGETTLTPRNAQWMNVTSIEDAVVKVAEYRAEYMCGARDWFGGIIRDEKKKPVAVVRMNGSIGTVESDAQYIINAKRMMSKK